MVTGLVDSSVLIDILRLQEKAELWLHSQEFLGVSSVVWIELIEGAPDRRRQDQAVRLLKRFERIEVLPNDFDWAISQLARFKLSHNVGGMDCLIASASHRLQLPLYTTNLKHFTPLLGDLAIKPY